MPMYEFERKGKRFEVYMSYGDLKRAERDDGSYVIRGKKCARVFSPRALTRSPEWAMGHRSSAMACHPDDAATLERELRRETGYRDIEVCRKTGDVITYSQKQKVAAAKAQGYVDLDGGYTA